MGDLLLRVVVVAAGAGAALGVGTEMPSWEVGILVAGPLLLLAGALANRWWAAAVLPVGTALYLAVLFALEPSNFTEGRDIGGAFFVAMFLAASLVAGGVVGAGVALRRTISAADHRGETTSEREQRFERSAAAPEPERANAR